MIKTGITGGIGTGKSTVAKMFALLGVPVYDADSRAKWLMNNDLFLKASIKETFGGKSYKENGELDRQYLAGVFSDEIKLAKLNSLVHPAVGEDFENWCKNRKKAPYVLKEAALLYEAGSFKTLEKIIVVTSPLDLRIQRIMKRDPFRSPQQIEEIIKRQMPEEEKVNRADFVVYNDNNHRIIPQVLTIHQEILQLTK